MGAGDADGRGEDTAAGARHRPQALAPQGWWVREGAGGSEEEGGRRRVGGREGEGQ